MPYSFKPEYSKQKLSKLEKAKATENSFLDKWYVKLGVAWIFYRKNTKPSLKELALDPFLVPAGPQGLGHVWSLRRHYRHGFNHNCGAPDDYQKQGALSACP